MFWRLRRNRFRQSSPEQVALRERRCHDLRSSLRTNLREQRFEFAALQFRDQFGRSRTDRKRAEQRLVAQHTVAQLLANAATIEEATPRVVVLLMRLEVLGEIGEPLAEERHLHLGGPGVRLVRPVRRDDRRLLILAESHRLTSLYRLFSLFQRRSLSQGDTPCKLKG